jgi:hypothetical protein
MSLVLRTVSDFPGGIDYTLLTSELNSETKLNGRLITISSMDGINITFMIRDYVPETDDVTVDSVILAHNPDPYEDISGYPDFTLSGNSTTSTTNSEYTHVQSFVYPGKAKTGYPGEIHLIATIEEGATSGAVRIYDATNNKIIAEMTNITATTPTIFSMPFDKTTLPVNKADFHIHVKCSSIDRKKKITFWSLLIDYNP